MSDIFKKDNPVYWDNEKQLMYWIEWEETGNNDIPHRRYIRNDVATTLSDEAEFCIKCKQTKRVPGKNVCYRCDPDW